MITIIPFIFGGASASDAPDPTGGASRGYVANQRLEGIERRWLIELPRMEPLRG